MCASSAGASSRPLARRNVDMQDLPSDLAPDEHIGLPQVERFPSFVTPAAPTGGVGHERYVPADTYDRLQFLKIAHVPCTGAEPPLELFPIIADPFHPVGVAGREYRDLFIHEGEIALDIPGGERAIARLNKLPDLLFHARCSRLHAIGWQLWHGILILAPVVLQTWSGKRPWAASSYPPSLRCVPLHVV